MHSEDLWKAIDVKEGTGVDDIRHEPLALLTFHTMNDPHVVLLLGHLICNFVNVVLASIKKSGRHELFLENVVEG